MLNICVSFWIAASYLRRRLWCFVFLQCKAEQFTNPRKMRPQWLIADVVPLMATSCGWCDRKDKFKKQKQNTGCLLVTTLLVVLKVQIVFFQKQGFIQSEWKIGVYYMQTFLGILGNKAVSYYTPKRQMDNFLEKDTCVAGRGGSLVGEGNGVRNWVRITLNCAQVCADSPYTQILISSKCLSMAAWFHGARLRRVVSMALETIIAAIICFQRWGPAVKG